VATDSAAPKTVAASSALTITAILQMIEVNNKLVVIVKETASRGCVSIGGCVSITIMQTGNRKTKNKNRQVVTATEP